MKHNNFFNELKRLSQDLRTSEDPVSTFESTLTSVVAEIHLNFCAQLRTLDPLREDNRFLFCEFRSSKASRGILCTFGQQCCIGLLNHIKLMAWTLWEYCRRMFYSEKIGIWFLFLLVASLGISAPGPTSTWQNDYLSDNILYDTCFRNFRCFLYSVGGH